MSLKQSEIEELKKIIPSVSHATEGGYDYLLLEDLQLPDNCTPAVVDALLCPNVRDGYNSRLYLSSQITSPIPRNWNGALHVFDRNWYAISWVSQAGLSLADMLMIHLKAFR